MTNKLTKILTILLAAVTLWACKNNNSGSSSGEENFDKDASYALGMNIGENFRESLELDGIVLNIDEFMMGVKDGITGGKTRFNMEEAINKIETAFSTLSESKNYEAMQNENAFLAENSRKPGVTITASGLQYEVITEGNGPKPLETSTVRVHYEGKLIDGTIFDSSYERGTPADFPINMVISGWTEGLQLMSVGSKYLLYIPSEQGYGTSGWGPIPPYATLIFTVELLDILEE